MKSISAACIAMVTLLILSLTACENSEEKEPTLDGLWRSVGYGRTVSINNGEYVMYETTEISCLELTDGEILEFGNALKLKSDTLSLQDGINTYYFTRINKLPTLCITPITEAKANDPEYNFDVIWKTFDEHYAYWDLRGVDPIKMYANYRPKVSSETTQPELFLILSEMLDAFNDGHIGISAPDEIEAAAEALYEASQEGQTAGNEATPQPKIKLRNYQVAQAVAEKYIPNGRSIKGGNLRWGILENNIGYLQSNQMMGLSNYGLSDTLSYRDYWMAYFEKLETVENDTEDELEGQAEELDKIMTELAETTALIIDVRFNGGGKDEVGMAFLSRLNAEEKVVFTKKGMLDDGGFTPTIKVVQPAVEHPYTQPVYLLIATESASATEIMALSSLSMPNITRIGSHTEGVFSDILDRVLPNGWEFGLSSEVYENMAGVNYEGKGIPPDVEIGYPRDTQKFLSMVMNEIKTTGDASIEKALELVQSN